MEGWSASVNIPVMEGYISGVFWIMQKESTDTHSWFCHNGHVEWGLDFEMLDLLHQKVLLRLVGCHFIINDGMPFMLLMAFYIWLL